MSVEELPLYRKHCYQGSGEKHLVNFVRAMNNEHPQLNIHFIPFLAPGHLIPLSNIATLFAARGHRVTVITTPSYAQILRKSSPSLLLHVVDFPAQEAGFSDGAEVMSAANDLESARKFFHASMLLRVPISRFLEQHPPDCVVADFFHPWVHDVANNLRIARLAFNGFSLFTVAAMESVRLNPALVSDADPFVIPDFPHCITMWSRPPKRVTAFLESLLETEMKSDGLIVNNFVELDGEEYIQHYEKGKAHKAWHLGPACLVAKSGEERGQKSVVSEEECVSWLNSKQAKSVVYVCFGSMCRFPDRQLFEMACGLEEAAHNFVWVVPEKKGKEDESEEEKTKWLPKGFEERNAEKGLIIRGWAPQLVILAHNAVGAFLTHCGWNSTLEAVTVGVPMLTWPVLGDQFYNERLVTEVRGVAVEVGATEWRETGYGEREKLVTRDCIEKAVRRLMDGGDEADQIRRRAQEFSDKAKQALQDGGSSYNNLTALIAHLTRLKRLRDTR
ncbi:UDP-glucose flavonoid 3-O-glucosyltransferase 7-like [Vigna umbellata]|uniref:UDP-glucose flavonoid 3-O-glucosyltransferase 7-like n=1 Tax=Vigna umbellata TaxID=87088 RepID=UPI001F5E4195|nr:UDP-glucose flavonoid 3-O-glucosyltransferase 7-like [Vigna umbellata]